MSVYLDSKLLNFNKKKNKERRTLLIKMFLEEEPEVVLKREYAWIRCDDYPEIIKGVIKALKK